MCYYLANYLDVRAPAVLYCTDVLGERRYGLLWRPHARGAQGGPCACSPSYTHYTSFMIVDVMLPNSRRYIVVSTSVSTLVLRQLSYLHALHVI